LAWHLPPQAVVLAQRVLRSLRHKLRTYLDNPWPRIARGSCQRPTGFVVHCRRAKAALHELGGLPGLHKTAGAARKEGVGVAAYADTSGAERSRPRPRRLC
jgi:hypothetical protein